MVAAAYVCSAAVSAAATRDAAQAQRAAAIDVLDAAMDREIARLRATRVHASRVHCVSCGAPFGMTTLCSYCGTAKP